jgi:hypothetical protein
MKTHVVTISNRALLWLAWGRRQSYPKSVSAALGLWALWFLELPWLLRPYMRDAKRNHGSRQKRKMRALRKPQNV